MRHFNFIIILFLFGTTYAQKENQKSDNINIIKNYLKLSNQDVDAIKDNDSIVAELFKSVKYSIKSEKINKRLKLFFNNDYNEKKLLVALEMDRIFKDRKGSFRFDDNINPNKAIHFNSAEEFLGYKKKLDSIISKTLKLKVKDTLNKKQNRD